MIIGVAIRFQHEGATIEVRLPKPNRHCDCFEYAAKTLGLPAGSHQGSENQGFYDRFGCYHNREKAMSLVRASGQKLLPMACDGKINKSNYLFSEDVW